MLSIQIKHKLSLSAHSHNLCFDLRMNVSICVSSKTADGKSNTGCTFVEVASFQDVGFLKDYVSPMIQFATVCLCLSLARSL